MKGATPVNGFLFAQTPNVPQPNPTAPSAATSTVFVGPPASSQASAGYTLKDGASNGLSLLALAVSLYALRRNIAQGQRTQLLARLQRSIKELDEKSAALTESLEENLLGNLSVHRKCATDWKSLQSLEKDLELHIPCESSEVFRAVQNWHQITMGDPYPVQVEDRALRPDSAHLDKVRAAQDTLHAFLMQLEDSCILGEVRYWKRKKRIQRVD